MIIDAEPQSIATLADAIQKQSVDYLKKIAALISDEKNKPVRKADLITFVRQRLSVEPGRLRQTADDPLYTLWRKLNPLQQAAVAETVHGPEPWFDAERFEAKYGQSPDWGETDRYGYPAQRGGPRSHRPVCGTAQESRTHPHLPGFTVRGFS